MRRAESLALGWVDSPPETADRKPSQESKPEATSWQAHSLLTTHRNHATGFIVIHVEHGDGHRGTRCG